MVLFSHFSHLTKVRRSDGVQYSFYDTSTGSQDLLVARLTSK